jgi:Cytochrome C and Quinol oxidase polypeptide I
VIGGSPDAGWTAYFPLSRKEFSPGIENNYYEVAIQIAGIGTTMSGINFIVTILKMRAKGMTLMKMPKFTWTTLITSITVTLFITSCKNRFFIPFSVPVIEKSKNAANDKACSHAIADALFIKHVRKQIC